jgi:hypothetical protein
MELRSSTFIVLVLLSVFGGRLAPAQTSSPTPESTPALISGADSDAIPTPPASPTPFSSPRPTSSPLVELPVLLVPQIQRSAPASQLAGVALELEPATESSRNEAQVAPTEVRLKVRVEDLKLRLAPSRVKWTQVEPGRFEGQVKLGGKSTPVLLLLVDQLGKVSSETIQIVLTAVSQQGEVAPSVFGKGFSFFLGWKPQAVLFNQSLVVGQKKVLAAESAELQLEQLFARVVIPVSHFLEVGSRLEFGQSTFSWDPGELRSPNAHADLRVAYRRALGSVLFKGGLGGGILLSPYLRLRSKSSPELAVSSFLAPVGLLMTELQVYFSPSLTWLLALQGQFQTSALALASEDRMDASSGFSVKLETDLQASPIRGSPLFFQGGLGAEFRSLRLEQSAPFSGQHSLQTFYFTASFGGGVKW